jgi:hypothetical protein
MHRKAEKGKGEAGRCEMIRCWHITAYYPRIRPGKTEEHHMETLSKDIQQSGQDSNQVNSENNFRSLELHQHSKYSNWTTGWIIEVLGFDSQYW